MEVRTGEEEERCVQDTTVVKLARLLSLQCVVLMGFLHKPTLWCGGERERKRVGGNIYILASLEERRIAPMSLCSDGIALTVGLQPCSPGADGMPPSR